ncbi:hypothetical protein PR202_ga31403 [Eleusine coracana subsp. coracana]|uniref:Cathepsin propeptide inhibitor domain-containing protein n=1 Tax=Eleusine coracana subsp. coracana TaxID=191504 RepID=A0AAV5DRL8_ELECO|nr:hypothetical protein PR202_ga31403 [Eleusine coracana subsp. coracana]
MASFLGDKPLATAALLLLIVLAVMNLISHITVEAREFSTGGYDKKAIKARHEKWMAKHSRTYGDEAEKQRRLEVFKANVDFIDRSNAAGDKKYHLGINEFADMTSDEFAAMYTGFRRPPVGAKKVSGFKYENFTLPGDQQQVDWRKKGAVTDIKNQGQCGT